MSIRKYLFWINHDGIRTFKIVSDKQIEQMRPSGKDVYADGDKKNFFSWFHKSASITKDEQIDFCFISDTEFEIPELNYRTVSKTSWNKEEIGEFCERYIPADSYEIIYRAGKSFVCQSGNVFDRKNIKKVYLKCLPELEEDICEEISSKTETISAVNRYFREQLEDL